MRFANKNQEFRGILVETLYVQIVLNLHHISLTGWQKRNRKVKVAEFIKELLSANCKRRDLKEIQDVKSETKKYLAGGMHAEETGTNVEKSEIKENERVDVKNDENRKKAKKDVGDIPEKKYAYFEFQITLIR